MGVFWLPKLGAVVVGAPVFQLPKLGAVAVAVGLLQVLLPKFGAAAVAAPVFQPSKLGAVAVAVLSGQQSYPSGLPAILKASCFSFYFYNPWKHFLQMIYILSAFQNRYCLPKLQNSTDEFTFGSGLNFSSKVLL